MEMVDGNDKLRPTYQVPAHWGIRFLDNWHLQRHQFAHTPEQPKAPPPTTGGGGKIEIAIANGNDADGKIRPYQCPHCVARFNDKWHLQRHIYTHTGGGPPKPTTSDKIGMCDGQNGGKVHTHCPHGHAHTCGDGKLRPYQCPHCVAKFTDKWHLQRHQFTHTGEQPFECEFCGKRFSQTYRLNIHRRLHTGEKPYKCQVCSYTGRTKEHLKRHMDTHSDERPFPCFECGKTFKRKDHLSLHVFTHNPEKKQFKCTICALRFSTPYNLKQHMVTHSDERRFFCDQCGKTFKRKDKLSLHVYTHNPDKKPFKCNLCALKFSTSYRLKQHMGKHSDEKLFQCGHCGKAFKRKDKLTRHLLTHNSDKSDANGPCAACSHTCFQHQPCNQPNSSTSLVNQSTSQPAYRQPNVAASQLYRQPNFQVPVNLVQLPQK